MIGIPPELIDGYPNQSRIKTSSQSAIEVAIAKGQVFQNYAEFDVAAGNVLWFVNRTPADKIMFINDLEIAYDLTATGPGSFTYSAEAYVQGSPRNSFSFTEGGTSDFGANLNASYINVLSDTQVVEVTGTPTVTGTRDYQIVKDFLFIQDNGSNRLVTGRQGIYIGDGKGFVIPPSTDVLYKVEIGGSFTGTVGVEAAFYPGEISING